jgi:hypothetical protein
VLIRSKALPREEIPFRAIVDCGLTGFILVKVFKKAVGLVFAVKPVLLVKIAEMKRFREIFGKVLANSFPTNRTAFYSASGS